MLLCPAVHDEGIVDYVTRRAPSKGKAVQRSGANLILTRQVNDVQHK